VVSEPLNIEEIEREHHAAYDEDVVASRHFDDLIAEIRRLRALVPSHAEKSLIDSLRAMNGGRKLDMVEANEVAKLAHGAPLQTLGDISFVVTADHVDLRVVDLEQAQRAFKVQLQLQMRPLKAELDRLLALVPSQFYASSQPASAWRPFVEGRDETVVGGLPLESTQTALDAHRAALTDDDRLYQDVESGGRGAVEAARKLVERERAAVVKYLRDQCEYQEASRFDDDGDGHKDPMDDFYYVDLNCVDVVESGGHHDPDYRRPTPP
jgi:hypothetical protein